MATWHRVSGDRGLGMAMAGPLTAGSTPLLHTEPARRGLKVSARAG